MNDHELKLRLTAGVVAVGVERVDDTDIYVASATTIQLAAQDEVAGDPELRVEHVVIPETRTAQLHRRLDRLPSVQRVSVQEDDAGTPSTVDVRVTAVDVIGAVRQLVEEVAGPSCEVSIELAFEFVPAADVE